ncbi:MAG: hypothetical protein J2P46_02900 [Zavarzinella sp.]|nr:hypothetical protein [Zavarzinella sp.]
MSDGSSVPGRWPALSGRESRARHDVRPFLHRATAHISFGPLKDAVARAQPGSRCEFLTRHGVPADVVEEVPRMPDVRIRGGANLDRVQALIDAWQAEGPD